LTAVGGLGRRELAPHSDIDLVVVSASVPPEGDPQFDAFVRELVHPLWDAGMRAGVMVHDPGTWLAEAADDLTLCTSLLDVRCLGGEAAIVEGLRRDAFEHLFGDRRRAFLLRLEQDIAERHTRYGGTVFLVEPDLKYGPGGLRDLAALQWSLMATHQTMDFAELTRRGVLRPRMASLLTSSRDVLLRLRVALQLAAKRSQDRLVFQYQELLPPLVGSLDEGPHDDAVLVEAIEIAMQEYYRAARDLLRYGARVRERCRPRLEGDASSVRRIDERFAVIDGRLRLEGADALRDTPVLALEALALARDQGLELSGETFDAIAEASATPAAEGLSREPEAQRQLFDLLCEPNDLGTPSSLELAVELGLLERVVPEFAPIRGRMQHDPYHVYTVDQHTLGAIAMLKRLARGEHNKDFPLATAVHLEIDDPRVLYLATLCHDMGKALPGDQCDVGAVVARTVAQRCGLPPVEAERCAKLVGEHLSMPLLSQKRDLSDPLLIAEFADTIGDRGTLKELYLLSLVDMAQVRPGNLTSWKLTLLDELYLQTCAHLQRGTVGARLPPRRRGELDGMPGRYYSLYHLDMRRHHARLVERLATEDRQAMLEVASGSGALRLTLVARDRPGLLAQATAIVDDHGLEILAADVFSAPGSTPVALDVFRVAAKDGPEHGVDVATVTAMEQALQRGLDRQFLQTPLPPRRGRRWHRPPVPTRIAFDRDPAGERSIVEVETEAGSDVLRRITLAFAAEGVSILLARCNTEAERAANVFYVPTLDDVQQRQLSGRLRRYLEPT
jgi:[protein-PII] uridylyltransferase